MSMAQEQQTVGADKPDAGTETPAPETRADKPAGEGETRAEPQRAAPPLPEGQHYFWGTGRRKRAIARVRIRPGSGQFVVNKRPPDEYFPEDRDRATIREPLQTLHMGKAWDVFVNVGGGGITGQAGAICLGLARALVRAMPQTEGELRGRGLLTRDPRMKERKKYGQPGARKRFQFSKR
jgi:small subunit ribosomal protein S9